MSYFEKREFYGCCILSVLFRGKQEMNEWIGAINLVAAHSSPPLMAPIANNPVPSAPTSETTESQEKKSSKSSSSANTFSSSSTPNSFQKHFKPAAFTNLKIVSTLLHILTDRNNVIWKPADAWFMA